MSAPDNNSNSPAPSDATTDHAPPTAAFETTIGTLGRFELRQELGQGAFGIVYRAYDPLLERRVAIKVPKFTTEHSDLCDRFLREAKAAARLQHTNIVTVYDCGAQGERLWIAYELVEGDTLSDRLAATRPSHRDAAQWVRALALALHHAHEQGVVHRDVKPANVLLEAGNRVRLTDFGISKDVSGLRPDVGSADPTRTRDGVVVGSPAYMAPEQARGDTAAIGPHTDQYGLGVLLYEMLTGHRPFDGSAAEVIAQVADPLRQPVPPREVDPEIPFPLEAIVLKATAKDPAVRYPTCADLAVDVQRWLNGDPVAAPLQIPEGWVRQCPGCGLGTPPPAVVCKYCGHGLAGTEPIDPTTVPHRVTKEPAGEAVSVRERLFRVVQWGVWLLLVAAACVVLLVNWHVAVTQAGGWEYPHPSFLDTLPVIKNCGQLIRGVILGLVGVGVGIVVTLAWVGTENVRAFADLARWSAAGAAVVLAIGVETTTRYPQFTRYKLDVAVVSGGDRVVKNVRMRVLGQHDQERSLHNRVYLDNARLRSFDPGRDTGAPTRSFEGTVSYSRSPLGFVFNPDPDRILLAVGYDDEGTGSCQCDDGIGIGYRHDHHTLAFPLRTVVDATPAAVPGSWGALRFLQPRVEANPAAVTIEVP